MAKHSTDLLKRLEATSKRIAVWQKQRSDFTTELNQIVSEAGRLLADLGADAEGVVSRRGGRRVRGAASGAANGRRRMSKAWRAKLAAAAKRRWAAAKKAGRNRL